MKTQKKSRMKREIARLRIVSTDLADTIELAYKQWISSNGQQDFESLLENKNLTAVK